MKTLLVESWKESEKDNGRIERRDDQGVET